MSHRRIAVALIASMLVAAAVLIGASVSRATPFGFGQQYASQSFSPLEQHGSSYQTAWACGNIYYNSSSKSVVIPSTLVFIDGSGHWHHTYTAPYRYMTYTIGLSENYNKKASCRNASYTSSYWMNCALRGVGDTSCV